MVFPMRSLLCLALMGFLAMLKPVLEWRDRSLMPEGISGAGTASFSGSLVVAGGTTWRNQVKHWLATTLIYNPRTDAWSDGPSLPEPLAYGAFLRNDRSLELLGGMNDRGLSRNCWRLDASSSRWAACGQVPGATLLGSAAELDGDAYLVGGCDDMDLRVCSPKILRRDGSGVWQAIAEVPGIPLAMAASAVVGRQIYLFGGCSRTADGVHNRGEALRFDPATRRWTALRSLPTAARGITALALNDHHILLAGGYTNATPGFSDATYVYDTDTDRYTPITSVPLPVMGLALVRDDKKIWALGGEDKAQHRSARLFEARLP